MEGKKVLQKGVKEALKEHVTVQFNIEKQPSIDPTTGLPTVLLVAVTGLYWDKEKLSETRNIVELT